MRRATFVVTLALLAGCTTASGSFAALAAQAPALLLKDAAAGGTLTHRTATIDQTMRMDMGGMPGMPMHQDAPDGSAPSPPPAMTMTMHVTSDTEFFAGGAYLTTLTMAMQAPMGAMPSTQMRLFCSPQRLLMTTSGSANGQDLRIDTANPIGSCPTGQAPTDLRLTNASLEASPQLHAMMRRSGLPTLHLERTEVEHGDDVAVYTTDMDLAQMGMTGNFSILERSTLSNGRIVSGVLSGEGDFAMGIKAHVAIHGNETYTYGQRAPVPADYAGAPRPEARGTEAPASSSTQPE